MKRVVLALLAIGLASCVSSQNASNGAFRLVNAVADSARMALLIDEEVRASGFDYATGTSFIALRAGSYGIALQETLPRVDTNDDGVVDSEDDENIAPVAIPPALQEIDLEVNGELTYVVAGHHGDEEFMAIEGLTAAVPTGQTRVQLAHAAVGAPAVDVYLAEEETESVTGLTPFEAGLAYLEDGDARLRLGGGVRMLITAAGDDEVLFDSGDFGLALERSLLFVIAPNTNIDVLERPFIVVLVSGGGATTLADIRSQGNYRFVNASAGAYAIDAFVTAVVEETEGDTRQAVCPVVGNEDFLASYCAMPYEFIGTMTAIEPSTYRVKVQIAGASTLKVKNFAGTFPRAGQSTLVLNERPPTDATVSDVELDTFTTTRRVAPIGQLRIVTFSEGLDATTTGDPTTDRVDIFITEDPDDPLDETARFRLPARRYGADSGYIQMLPGIYQLTIAKVDPADEDDVPVPLYTDELRIEGSGVYTLLYNDTVPGTLPLRVLSLEDSTEPPP